MGKCFSPLQAGPLLGLQCTCSKDLFLLRTHDLLLCEFVFFTWTLEGERFLKWGRVAWLFELKPCCAKLCMLGLCADCMPLRLIANGGIPEATCLAVFHVLVSLC